MSRVELLAPDGLGEVREGDDLAGLVLEAIDLRDGDIVVVTSKVVSKAEGLVRTGGRDGGRDQALSEETVRVVARRGSTTIVRTRHGLTLAAAGIDASNVPPGSYVLLPRAPDDSARRLREELMARTGALLGVIVTDTAGRAWRQGQVDIAIGASGVRVLDDHFGRVDPFGNPLMVTAPAVADEIAAAAELVQPKLTRRPVAVLRGRADLVLATDDATTGAAALARPEGADLFGYGAREAVVRALAGNPEDRPGFGDTASPSDLLAALRVALHAPDLELIHRGTTAFLVHTSASLRAVEAVCFAHGWELADMENVADNRIRARLHPAVT